MSYPDDLLVISPHIRTMMESFGPKSFTRKVFYLEGFAALQVKRATNGRFHFRERYEHDQVGDRSVELLICLCGLMAEGQPALAALRLGELASALVQVPLGSVEQVEGKVSLLHMRDAMLRQPIDAALLDAEGGIPTLKRAAFACDLLAEWDEPGAGYNPERLRRQLTARTQSMWVAIAKRRLPAAGVWQAMADFAGWKEAQMTT